MTTEAKWGATLIVAVMWTAVSVVGWPPLALHLRLRTAAGVAEGEVAKVDAHDHNRATYRYTVAGRVYANSEIASHRQVGEKVRVYYSLKEPSASMLRDPASSLGSDVWGLLILYTLIAVGAFFMAARSSRGVAK